MVIKLNNSENERKFLLFSPYKSSVENLIKNSDEFAFLAGAGVSKPPPSNLPTAQNIIDSLLEIMLPSEERKKIRELYGRDFPKFEEILGIFKKFYDKKEKLFDYFEYNKIPNIIHYFLAKMILKGQFVVTTNFDYCIESALLDLLPEKLHRAILVLITKRDFKKFKNPQKTVSRGRYPLYKVHGSKKNIINGWRSRDSIISTTEELGKNIEHSGMTKIKECKHKVLKKVTQNRTLIVLGYSGNDSFDVGPFLMEQKLMKKIIWIEHEEIDDYIIERVNKIEDFHYLSQLNQIQYFLGNLTLHSDIPVFRIRCNTADFVKKHLWSLFLPDQKNIFNNKYKRMPLDFDGWLKKEFHHTKPAKKYRNALDFYIGKDKDEEVDRCIKIGLELAKKDNDLFLQSSFLNMQGNIATSKREYGKALSKYQESLEIENQLNKGVNKNKAIRLKNIGEVYFYKLKNISYYDYTDFDKYLEECDELKRKSIESLSQTLTLFKKLRDGMNQATILGDLGDLYIDENKVKSLEFYKKSLSISRADGLLYSELKALIKLGEYYYGEFDFESSLNCLNQAYVIAENLREIFEIFEILFLSSKIQIYYKNYMDALNLNYKALRIIKVAENTFMNSRCITEIIHLNIVLKYYEKSMDYLHQLKNIYYNQDKNDKSLLKYHFNVIILNIIKNRQTKVATDLDHIISIANNAKDNMDLLETLNKLHNYSRLYWIEIDQFLNYLNMFNLRIKDNKNNNILGSVKKVIGISIALAYLRIGLFKQFLDTLHNYGDIDLGKNSIIGRDINTMLRRIKILIETKHNINNQDFLFEENVDEKYIHDKETFLYNGIHIGSTKKTKDMASNILRETSSGLNIIKIDSTNAGIRKSAEFLSKIELKNVLVFSNAKGARCGIMSFCYLLDCIQYFQYHNEIIKEIVEEKRRKVICVIIINPKRDLLLLKEAQKFKIPVIAITNTDDTLKGIDYSIPGNNSGYRSISTIMYLLCQEILKKKLGITKNLKLRFSPDVFSHYLYKYYTD
ncbi:MAG: 30S ribosomal protein S2 [Candidatus Lokiarchaeota archaeon]|nr:30S ribosomal protein S2 [Candidatus Lokiarchaeota archaeon]